MKFKKILVRKTMKDEVVSEWYRMKDHELSCVVLSLPAFKISINVAFGPYDEFKRFVRDKFDHVLEHEDCNAMAVSLNHKKTRWHWLCIQKNEWRASDYGIFTHELHHITHFALKEMGVDYHDTSEEVYAYVQGYFMELLVRAFVQLFKAERKALKARKAKKKKRL